jgi:hypothetical protein
VDQKIWFMQDSTKFRSEILIRICFKPRADTCVIPIGPYYFVWISDVERRILKDLDIPDWTIPVHLSELIWSTGSRSGGHDLKREEKVPKLGFRRNFRQGCTSGQRRRCSGGSWSAMRSRRNAAGREGLMVRSASSIASCEEREGRLEWGPAAAW